MEKEEYIKKMKELQHTREKALAFNRRETEKVKKQYITENCKFKVGDVVESPEGVRGTILELAADEDGFFGGEWVKIKKDGNPYHYPCRFSSFDYARMQKV